MRHITAGNSSYLALVNFWILDLFPSTYRKTVFLTFLPSGSTTKWEASVERRWKCQPFPSFWETTLLVHHLCVFHILYLNFILMMKTDKNKWLHKQFFFQRNLLKGVSHSDDTHCILNSTWHRNSNWDKSAMSIWHLQRWRPKQSVSRKTSTT